MRAEFAELKESIGELEVASRIAAEKADSLLIQLPNLPTQRHRSEPMSRRTWCSATRGLSQSGRKAPSPTGRLLLTWGSSSLSGRRSWSGSGFSTLRGDGARLLRALVQFGLDLNSGRYEEVHGPAPGPPGDPWRAPATSPKFAEDAYNTTPDDLWAIPTGEVPLTGFHRDEILDAAELPQAVYDLHGLFP